MSQKRHQNTHFKKQNQAVLEVGGADWYNVKKLFLFSTDKYLIRTEFFLAGWKFNFYWCM